VPVVCSEQPRHVLAEHEGACPHSANQSCDVIKQIPFVIEAGSWSGDREWLAREPGGHDVDLGQLVEGGEVPEVGCVGHVGGEPVACARVDVGDEHRFHVDTGEV